MKLCLKCGEKFTSPEWLCPVCGWSPPMDHGIPHFALEFARENACFDEASFQLLSEVEERYFWFRARYRLIHWAWAHYCMPSECFLEVGCGIGHLLLELSKSFSNVRFLGGEIFTEALSRARSRLQSRATLLQIDARRIPFAEEFDGIGLFDVLEHIEEDQIVLEQMFQGLKPGGKILLTVPQHPFLWGPSDDFGRHKRRYRREDLAQKMEQTGYKIIRITSFVSLLLPCLILSRFHAKWLSRSFDPMAEFKIGGFLNSALGKIMDFESFLIRHGVSFPAGGSLLVVAKRPER